MKGDIFLACLIVSEFQLSHTVKVINGTACFISQIMSNEYYIISEINNSTFIYMHFSFRNQIPNVSVFGEIAQRFRFNDFFNSATHQLCKILEQC